MRHALSPQQALDRLRRTGRTVCGVAKELGVKPWIVRDVLSGKLKGNWGDAHRVAVVLGIKHGVVVAADVPLSEALKAADRSIRPDHGTTASPSPRLNKQAA